jgi:hypothetical protein
MSLVMLVHTALQEIMEAMGRKHEDTLKQQEQLKKKVHL